MVTLALCYWLKSAITVQFSPTGWNEGNLYGAVFNWSSIQSGFVFAIYGFIVTKRDGFVGRVIGGSSYERFLSFTKRACYGGFLLTIVSLPLLVASPEIAASQPLMYWPIAIWFALFVWAFCAFLRVAFTFGIIVATPDRRERIPG